ncbi:hypothetical protein CEK28_08480 [Xenophilus sp. AP218F]|nr:hypothetical protein CEK28_08480 [Xenophilus sp. AP218F]
MSGLFDLRESRRVEAHDPIAGYAERHGAPADDAPEHPLDSQAMLDLHTRLVQLYSQEMDRQADNRLQMALDEDYYDGLQWSPEDAQVLRDRGQWPIVINHISPAVNWILGSERRTRVDYRVLGRTEEDNVSADIKTQLLKYLSDSNRLPFERSEAFRSAVVAGLGWLEDGAQYGDDGEEIYSRSVPWREMLYDSKARRDLSDARYLFRSKMLDLDIAAALYRVPEERMHVLEGSALNGVKYGVLHDMEDEVMREDEFDGHGFTVRSSSAMHIRRRVRVFECWYRVPEYRMQFRNGPASGERFDSANAEHVKLLQSGFSVIDRFSQTMKVAHFTAGGMLWQGDSPYRHNDFPYTPVWGNRRGRDGMPYGLVRGLRDMQDDINKKHSKAQFILATTKVIMDEGAVEDINVLADEVARPDGIIVKRPNKQLQLDVDRNLAPAHLDMMQMSAQMIQSTSGVTDELLGRRTNAVSGAAITARQEQGSLQTSLYFDNLRFARQIQGEKQLALMEQFYTEAKVFRLTNEHGEPAYTRINDPNIPASQVAGTRADFVIDEAPYSASYRQAMVETLGALLQRMPPDVAAVMLPMMIEMMDLPNRDEVVKQIRAKLGIPDPKSKDDPAQQAAEAAAARQQAMAEKQAQLALDKMALELDKARIENARLEANTIATRLEGMASATAAASQLAASPGIAAAADQMLAEAGLIDPSGQAAQISPADPPPGATQDYPADPQTGVMPQ